SGVPAGGGANRTRGRLLPTFRRRASSETVAPVNFPTTRRAMSPLKQSTNIAARMGRWSASHWKTAVFGWLAFVVVALAIGMQVGTKQIADNNYSNGEAHKADKILEKGFPQSDPLTEIVVVQSATRTVGDPAFRATVDDVVKTVEGNPQTKNFKSPLDPRNADQVSKDRRTVMVTWEMRGELDHAQTKIDAIENAVNRVG